MILDILKDTTLTYGQKVIALARAAEDSVEPIALSPQLKGYLDSEVIHHMFEGNAPYRPRYIVPNYNLLMEKGCDFLKLAPPTNLLEALETLKAFYHHVPSITTFPVYIGELDTLLSPFVPEESDEAYQQLKWFLVHLDRTITDSFCHANLSGTDNPVARMLLKLERQLEHSVPNLTLKVKSDTPNALMEEAVLTALKVAKPSFAHDAMFLSDFGQRPYGIVSCYNGLLEGGGSYTLVRLNLGRLASSEQNNALQNKPSHSDSAVAVEGFMESLKDAVAEMLLYMDQRVNFLLNESDFFQTHFLVKEGFITKEGFTAMFGLVGLADAVNTLLGPKQFGWTSEAEALGLRVIQAIEAQVNHHHHPALYATHGKYVLHAQVGLDVDMGISPGCRIPIGHEPTMPEHILSSAPYHKYFPSGIGDIFRFDETLANNPGAAVSIIRGAFKEGLRYFSLYEDNADVVRITGYLVKKSDIQKLQRGEQVINDAAVLGKGAVENQKVLDRKLRT